MAPKPSAASARAARQQLLDHGRVYLPSWNQWTSGDICGIVGEAGVFKVMSFDHEGPRVLVTVVGGPVWGQEQTKEFRTFTADRLTTKIVKRGTKKKEEDDETAL